MPELAKQYDVAEQLKAENQMEWAGLSSKKPKTN